jgi:hypothetical protein
MDGSPEDHKLVKESINEWTKYANLNFDYVESNSEAEVRAAFGNLYVEPGATYAFMGMQSADLSSDKPTLYLGLLHEMAEKDKRRLVLHELGHILGLFHEHQNPNCTNFIEFKKPDIYEFYLRTSGWTPDTVDAQIVKPYEVPYRAFDPKSIMMFELPPQVTRYPGPLRPRLNEELSESDKAFIARLYPRGNNADTPAKSERLTVNGPPVRASIDLGVGKRYYHFNAESAGTFEFEVNAEYAGQVSIFAPGAAGESLKTWTLDANNTNPYRITLEKQGRYVIGILSEYGNQLELRVRRDGTASQSQPGTPPHEGSPP